MSSREQFEAWGMSDPDLSETLKSEVYASIAWMAWQAASKASEHQLAAVVAALSSQTELSVAAERTWERTMMYACGEDGPKSVADNFAELESKLETALRECRSAGITIDNLEAKCAKIAAENAGLKFYLRNDPVIRKGGEFVAAHQFAPETPSTDAFLAEVRAQGVEIYADNLDNVAGDAERGGFDYAVKFLRSEASSVRLFADQLRKGGTSEQD